MKIWIVHGSTGEDFNRMEWIVEAHDTKAAAQARVKRLTELFQRMSSYTERRKAKAMQEHPEGDPRCDIDYTGTFWYVSECELKQS